jgi:hypothetical protein
LTLTFHNYDLLTQEDIEEILNPNNLNDPNTDLEDLDKQVGANLPHPPEHYLQKAMKAFDAHLYRKCLEYINEYEKKVLSILYLLKNNKS